jgi:hypothetical protein
MPYVENVLDNHQFAYINKRSTDDAICKFTHNVTRHLDDNASNTVRALYIDYSSAFNNIQSHLMIEKLAAVGVPAHMRLWVLDYLSDRPQFVRTFKERSSTITINTGAPQGCVLSPILFILYTNDLRWQTDGVFLQKYADDTVVVGLLKNNQEDEYRQCISALISWCDTNYLDLNVSKTKEIIWDFRRTKNEKAPVIIKGVPVEITRTYKYLGLTMDDKLSYCDHVDNQLKKANKRLYCVRTMKKLNVDIDLICMFFNATIPPVIMYACASFYGCISDCYRKKMDKVRRICSKICRGDNVRLITNDKLYNDKLSSLSKSMIKTPSISYTGNSV